MYFMAIYGYIQEPLIIMFFSDLFSFGCSAGIVCNKNQINAKASMGHCDYFVNLNETYYEYTHRLHLWSKSLYSLL